MLLAICRLPAGSPRPVTGRFWAGLLLALLAGCAAYAALVLNQATYADVLAQGRLAYFDGAYDYLPVRVSARGFAHAQQGALGVAAALALAALGSGGLAAGRREWRALGAEAWVALAGAARMLRRLPPGQRRVAALSLGLLTGARLYFSLVKSYHADEVASYDFFIRPGLLAVSSFYPIPNNHVLANTLSWVFFQLTTNVWFTLRLPVLLTSTLGTVALFAGLVRFSSFRVALVALTLFGWLQPSLYYAVAGRGYWLLMTLAGLHFLALVALLARPRGARVAWATLLLTGVLGCYTVPTFAYVLASTASYLGVLALRRRAWAALGRVALLGLGVGAGAALLYGPLLLLSGRHLLLANAYVVPRPWSAVVRALPGFVWRTESTLFGQDTVGALGVAAGLGALAGLLWLRARAGYSPDRCLAAALRRLGWPALWFGLVPYALLLMQRVLPPARTLLYKALFFFILVGLVVEGVRRARLLGRAGPWLAGAGLTLFVAYQAYTMSRLVVANRRDVAQSWAAFDWLAARPPGPVLVSVDETALYLLFLAHYRTPHRPWALATRARPGARYRYVVVAAGYQGPYRPAPPARPAYHNTLVDLYELPAPGQPVPPDPALP